MHLTNSAVEYSTCVSPPDHSTVQYSASLSPTDQLHSSIFNSPEPNWTTLQLNIQLPWAHLTNSVVEYSTSLSLPDQRCNWISTPVSPPNHFQSAIFNSHEPTWPPLEFNIQLLYNALPHISVSPPNHLQSLIFNSYTIPYPMVKNSCEPTQPPPEFNIQLLYNALW